MIELEKTYLVKSLPNNLEDCNSVEILDIYIPKSGRHPVLRIRKRGENHRITKKEPVENDASNQKEDTISLSKEEYRALNKLEGKRVRKIRYYYNYHGHPAEVDVFQDKLKGLVTVDFEFDSVEEKEKFEMPDFCLADVTNEEFIAGGMLCGKSFEDIQERLKEYNYKKIEL